MEHNQTANRQIQKANRTAVYTLIRTNHGLSRKDIVNTLNLSLPTVTQNVKNLMKEGLIKETSFQTHTGGRKARLYETNPQARFAVGLDITKDKISCVLLDLQGKMLLEQQERCPFSRTDAYYQRIGQLVETIIKESKINRKKVLGVGIGIPGLVETNHEKVFYGEILKITGITSKEFSKFIHFPSALFNDAKVAGFADCWMRGKVGNAFYLMLSNNIGGAIILDNQVLPGAHLHSGEVGHLTLHPNGKKCYCGETGCVDSYLSATVLTSISDGNLDEFFSLLNKKDEKAREIWEKYLDDLALTANNVQALLDMKVILGGYVGGHMDDYIDELREKAGKLNTFEHDADYIELCQYKKNSIAAGAALEYIDAFVQSI